jgi:MerR family transcriptional regulator/heat shock protein HspR
MYQRARPRVSDPATGFPQAPLIPPAPGTLAPTPSRPRAKDDSETEAGQVVGVYVISVAARILDMHPQTLRKYERLGLISPGRTVGMLRLYSRDDINKLYLIRHLVENLGFNLAGVEFTLALVDQLRQMQDRLSAAATGTPLEGPLEQEIAHLFHTLNLPLESGRI